jgi:hypothetical protein
MATRQCLDLRPGLALSNMLNGLYDVVGAR